MCFPALERFKLDSCAIDVAFCADGEIVDRAGGELIFSAGMVEAKLWLRGAEMLDVERCERVTMFLADNVLKLGPGEIDLEVQTRGVVEVLDRTVWELGSRRLFLGV